jgi:hypothetical protein
LIGGVWREILVVLLISEGVGFQSQTGSFAKTGVNSDHGLATDLAPDENKKIEV